MENRLQSLLQLGPQGPLGNHFQGASGRSRRDGLDCRWLRRPCAPRRIGRKRGIKCNALGRSRGGFSTKIHAVVDTKGRPIHVTITQGQRHEMIAAPELLENARGKALIGDAGYDSNAFLQAVRDKGMKPVIHSKPERRKKHRLARPLSPTLPRRMLLPHAQALSRSRDPIRKDRPQLPRSRAPHVRPNLAGELGDTPSRWYAVGSRRRARSAGSAGGSAPVPACGVAAPCRRAGTGSDRSRSVPILRATAGDGSARDRRV